MRMSRSWVGLYGVLFHVLVVAAVAWVGHRNRAEIPLAFWVQAVPALFAAAFAVYALVVGPYVPRRPAGKGAVLFDSAVGMFAETAVFVLTAFAYAALTSIPALREGGLGAYAAGVANGTFFAILWSFGSFFLQILVVGNAAGLVGWWLLGKLARPPAAA